MLDTTLLCMNREIIVSFHNSNGLKSRDGKNITHLMIAGSDRNFIKAEGRIQDDSLIIPVKAGINPKWIRLGWDQFGNHNLVNRHGIPAVPFEEEVQEML